MILKETLSTVSTKLSNTWSQIKSKAKRLYSNDYNYEKTSSIRGIPLSSSANEDLLFYSTNRSHEEIEDIVSETSQSSSGSITSSLKDFQDEFSEKKNEILENVGIGYDDEFDENSISLIKQQSNYDFKLRYKKQDKNSGNSSTINLESLIEVNYEYCKIIII